MSFCSLIGCSCANPGPTGPQGPAGPTGATGPAGPSGAGAGAYQIIFEVDESNVTYTPGVPAFFDLDPITPGDLLLSHASFEEATILAGHDTNPGLEINISVVRDSTYGYFNRLRVSVIYTSAGSYTASRIHFSFGAVFLPVTPE